MSKSFIDLAKDKTENWLEYCNASWQYAGTPNSLDPSAVFSQPVQYNEDIYAWQESKFEHEFEAVFKLAGPHGSLVKELGTSFSSIYATYFDAWSVWKQLRPMFAFATGFGDIVEGHRVAATAYTLAQGVPSMAVDKVLDTLNISNSKKDLQELLPFCSVAYITGLRYLRDKGFANQFEDTFLKYTGTMYELMWKEYDDMFKVPEHTTSKHLKSCANEKSRLLSSVFFSITIEWAYILAGKKITSRAQNSWKSLRRVRQLCDEIIDLEEDYVNGIITYPMLYSLASKKHGNEFYDFLSESWKVARKDNTLLLDQISKYRSYINQTGALFCTAELALNELLKAMEFIMDSFDASVAFEITLVVNQRLATLTKRAYNNWNFVADNYEPQIFSLLSKN